MLIMSACVVQLISAERGFYVRKAEGDEASYTPVAAWALMEDSDGDRWIEPVAPAGGGWTGRPAGRDAVVVHARGEIEEKHWPPRSGSAALKRTLAANAETMKALAATLEGHERTMRNLVGELDEHSHSLRRSLSDR